jgi:hypothetical protein
MADVLAGRRMILAVFWFRVVSSRRPETRERDGGESVAEGDGGCAGVQQRARLEPGAELIPEMLQAAEVALVDGRCGLDLDRCDGSGEDLG